MSDVTTVQQVWLKSFPEFYRLEEIIGYSFVRRELGYEALTHSSYAESSIPWNERLEFLGDAVLGLVIGAELIAKAEDLDEGGLSRTRSALVNEARLAQVARRIDLGNYILLSKGEELSGGRERDALLADAVEALIGAVYSDQGFTAARAVTLCLFAEELSSDLAVFRTLDFKTELQEYCQEILRTTPTYRISAQDGPPHAMRFEVAVEIAGREIARGIGSSKKRASQEAAKVAWERVQKKV